MSDDESEDADKITEEQVRRGFEEIYGVTIEQVLEVLEESLAENHRLLAKIEAARGAFDEAGFTDEERDSMQGIQDYVDGRNES